MSTPRQPLPSREPPSHCPLCDGVPRFYLALPDTAKGTSVNVYRCRDCHNLIWED
ncbi:rubrerythrin [Bradyrhizobium sp. USDA 376]